MTPNEIRNLKAHARKAYENYMRESNDCGTELAEYLSPILVVYRDQFNSAMNELAKVDPECPSFRL